MGTLSHWPCILLGVNPAKDYGRPFIELTTRGFGVSRFRDLFSLADASFASFMSHVRRPLALAAVEKQRLPQASQIGPSILPVVEIRFEIWPYAIEVISPEGFLQRCEVMLKRRHEPFPT